MNNPKLTLRLGLSALLIAFALSLTRPHWLLSIDDRFGDLFTGLFYGLAFGLLLLTLHLRRKSAHR